LYRDTYADNPNFLALDPLEVSYQIVKERDEFDFLATTELARKSPIAIRVVVFGLIPLLIRKMISHAYSLTAFTQRYRT
jgi:hypothetical protein